MKKAKKAMILIYIIAMIFANMSVVFAEGEDVFDAVEIEKNDTDASFIGEIEFHEEGEDVLFGEELATADGWICDGWTGDFQNGFTHVVGQTVPLVFNMGNTGTKLYKIEFDVYSPSGNGQPNAAAAFTVSIGNSPRFITYKGGYKNTHYCYSIRSVSNGDFKVILAGAADPFLDTGIFDGTITNISIKEILRAGTTSNVLYDKYGNTSVEMFADLEEHDNLFIGKNSGLNNFFGTQNVAIGTNALANNGSGFWNMAIGSKAMENNTTGTRNVALGRKALQNNTVGDRNYAIGSFALQRNTSGRRNIAIGADALWTITDGISNIAIGSPALADLKSGNMNIAIGQSAGGFKEGTQNIAIGYASMGTAKEGINNIAIGREALYRNSSNNNIAFGLGSLAYNTTGFANMGMGYLALNKNSTGSHNIAIGHLAGYKSTGNGNTFIGATTGQNTTGAYNTFIGYQAGNKVTTGQRNVCIGRYVEPSSNEASDELNIANTLYGKINQGFVGIKKKTDLKGYLNIGAGDGTTPQMVMDKGELSATTVSGAIEYDGMGLYITLEDGKRYKISLEPVE